jgi:hypothetical protein
MSDNIPFFGNMSYGAFGNISTSNNMKQNFGLQTQQVFSNHQTYAMNQNNFQSENISEIQTNKEDGEDKGKKKKKKKNKKNKTKPEDPENKENEINEANEEDEGEDNGQGIIKASKVIQKKTLKKLLTKAGKNPEEMRRSKKRPGNKGPNGNGIELVFYIRN